LKINNESTTTVIVAQTPSLFQNNRIEALLPGFLLQTINQ